MAYLNENYLKLQAGYLFPEIARRVRDFCDKNPQAAERLIRCGIGDVTEPLPRAAIEAGLVSVDGIVLRKPSRKGVFGSQPRSFLARLLSATRLMGPVGMSGRSLISALCPDRVSHS